MLAGLGERHRGFERGAGFGRFLALPPVIAAPAADRDDDENAAGNGEVAVALPQLLQLFAPDFFIDFLEYVGHGPQHPPKSSQNGPKNSAALSLTMWRQQGKDQRPQCFTGKWALFLAHPVDVVGTRKGAGADLVGIALDRLFDGGPELTEPLDEFRHPRRQAEHVLEHQNLAVA